MGECQEGGLAALREDGGRTVRARSGKNRGGGKGAKARRLPRSRLSGKHAGSGARSLGRKTGSRKAAPRRRSNDTFVPRSLGGRKPTYRDIFERLHFNSYVDIEVGIEIDGEWSACWLWTGSFNREGGYPRLSIRIEHPLTKRLVRKTRNAHKVSWEEHHEKKVPEGMVLRHLCDRSACIHPNHLTPGTQGENMQDVIRAGRHVSQTRAKKERVPGEDDE